VETPLGNLCADTCRHHPDLHDAMAFLRLHEKPSMRPVDAALAGRIASRLSEPQLRWLGWRLEGKRYEQIGAMPEHEEPGPSDDGELRRSVGEGDGLDAEGLHAERRRLDTDATRTPSTSAATSVPWRRAEDDPDRELRRFLAGAHDGHDHDADGHDAGAVERDDASGHPVRKSLVGAIRETAIDGWRKAVDWLTRRGVHNAEMEMRR